MYYIKLIYFIPYQNDTLKKVFERNIYNNYECNNVNERIKFCRYFNICRNQEKNV